MSLEKAKKYLEEKGYADHVIELEESSATVQLAAAALGVEQGMIAKTMSFLVDGEPILILTEGTAKVDNRKYKDQFHVKAKMIPFDEVEEYIGHAPATSSSSAIVSLTALWSLPAAGYTVSKRFRDSSR